MRKLRRKGRGYRVFFATDLHGSSRCFGKFLSAVGAYGVDTLICGGDVTGKTLVLLIEHRDGVVTAQINGQAVRCTTREDVEAVKKRLASGGMYSHEMKADEASTLTASHVGELFRAKIRERLGEWIALAERRLDDGVGFYWMPGNDDYLDLDPLLSSSDRLVFADQRVVALPNGWSLLSLGLANETPWQCPRDVSEEEIGERIDALATNLPDARRTVFNIHVPPIATQLDRAPALDSDLRPRSTKSGGLEYASVGSTAVREALEHFKPAVSLHGHIHESVAVDAVYSTLSINPGSDFEQGVLRGALIELGDDAEVANWRLTMG